MTEIPEHLLRRSAEARARATGAPAAGEGEAPAAAQPDDDDGVTIPRSLLEASQQPGGAPAAGPAAAGGGVATALPPLMGGPAGNTHRLLTVVKSGSIQDVKASPGDKVHVWPHLLAAEFTAALFITAFTLVFSLFINAPLLELANHNETPNPSQGAVVLPGPAGTAHDVRPDDRRRDDPRRRAHIAGLRPLCRQEPLDAARGPQVRHLGPDDPSHVLGSPGDHRLVLPGAGLQLHLPWDTGLHGIFHL